MIPSSAAILRIIYNATRDHHQGGTGVVGQVWCAMECDLTTIYAVVVMVTLSHRSLLIALVHSFVYAEKLLSSPETAISGRLSTTAATFSVFFFLLEWIPSSIEMTKCIRKSYDSPLSMDLPTDIEMAIV